MSTYNLTKEGFLTKKIDGSYVTEDGVVFKFKVEGTMIVVDIPAPGNRTITQEFQIYDIIGSDFKFGNDRQQILKQPAGKYIDGKFSWRVPSGNYIELNPVILSVPKQSSFCSIL